MMVKAAHVTPTADWVASPAHLHVPAQILGHAAQVQGVEAVVTDQGAVPGATRGTRKDRMASVGVLGGLGGLDCFRHMSRDRY